MTLVDPRRLVNVTPRPRHLANEVAPFSVEQLRYGGGAWVENPDPVLRTLAKVGDESQWRIMERSEPVISSSKALRVNTLLAAGFQVVEGESGSPRAVELRRWTEAFIRRIPHWKTVLRKCLDAVYWGWRPLEVIWSFDWVYEGRTYWGVQRIYDRLPEYFRFTPERHLIWVGPGISQPEWITFDRPEDELKWLICTHGSTDNPYGEALFRDIWLLWFIKSRFQEMWSRGMGRSLGLIKAHLNHDFASAVGSTAERTIPELAAELRDVIAQLNNANVLIEKEGWELDFSSDIRFSEGWRHPLEYCDELLRIAIAGQTLAQKIGNVGSRAAAETQRKGLIDYGRGDGAELEGWINDGLLHPAVYVNHGEVAPEDMPRFESRLGKEADLDAAKALFAMGAPIDGQELASQHGVPIVLEPQGDDLVLQKPAEGFSTSEPGFGGTETPKVQENQAPSGARGESD